MAPILSMLNLKSTIMKRFSLPLHAALATAVLLLTATGLRAQDLVRYKADPGNSKVSISGTSTLHDWTVESQLIGGFVELPADFPLDAKSPSPAPGKVASRTEVIIPVRSLKSGKKGMDDVMHEAMKYQQHPRIEYKLLELALKEGAPATGVFVFDATGTLTLAGVTRTNKMDVTLTRVDEGKLRFTGGADLKMTDFGIQPPSPKVALGLISTGDEVRIEFDWVTNRAE